MTTVDTIRHVPAGTTDSRIAELRDQYAETLRRSQQLSEIRARAELRRQEIRVQRSRLHAEMTVRRSALLSAEAAAAAAILDSALKVSGIGFERLWLDYVSLGGDATRNELRAVLDGEAPLRRLDHDRLVVALNERLAEAGQPPLLAFWDGTR